MRGNIFGKRLCAAALSGLLIFLSQAGAQNQNVSSSGMDSERLARIPVRMKKFVEQGTIAGVVTLIARRGQVVSLEAVGYQDLESRKPMQADTIFDIRSVTKPITAIGIMVLMEEGKLTLNEPIEKYLPEFRATGKAQDSPNRITILHLLTHTAGMPMNRPLEIEDITVTRDRTLADVVVALSKQKSEFEPGTQFRYYSGGFAILGRIIEVVSGKPFEQFIKERIFDPLGMKDSFFFIPAEKQNRVASIYRQQDGKLNRWEEIEAYARNAKYPAPEFGMYSTASDLASLCQMMLNGGSFKGKRILSRMSVETMTQNHTLNIKSAITQRPAYQGLGWGLSGDPMDAFPLTSTGSFGHNGAFGAIIWIDPKEKLIRVFLDHRLGFNNESNIFMAMAGSAVAN
jgi:CubicO group peptidase (beta-lactamase class C family)